MAGAPIDFLWFAFRNVMLWTGIEGAPGILPLKQSATERLLVEATIPALPAPVITDLATHVFAAAGGVLSFDPVAVDVQNYRAFGFWSQSSPGVNGPIAVSMINYSGLGGAGVASIAPPTALPATSGGNQFFCSPINGAFYFDNVNLASANFFRSVAFGVILAAGPAETINVGYVGIV